MHKTTYTNYEQGKHTVPLDFAVTLSEFYGVSIDYIAGLTNCVQGNGNTVVSEDEKKLLRAYSLLSERNKGKLELFIEQLLDKQKNEKSAP